MSSDENLEIREDGQMPDAVRKAVLDGESMSPEPNNRTAPSAPSGGAQSLEGFLKTISQNYEEVELPSRGLLYDGALPGGKIHLRSMTMKEEKLLSTQRLVRTGQVLDRIFESCIKEHLDPSALLSADRTFLLIWLRGISYGPEYDVQIKCPGCNNSFPETINLNELPVDFADDDLKEPIYDELPRAGVGFSYRFMRGADEMVVSRHRERSVRSWGDEAVDDTLIVRDRILIDSIGDFTDKAEIETILENLSAEDSSYINTVLTSPGFGVDTSLPMICPMCSNNFNIELPIDANFFFPRAKRKKQK